MCPKVSYLRGIVQEGALYNVGATPEQVQLCMIVVTYGQLAIYLVLNIF